MSLLLSIASVFFAVIPMVAFLAIIWVMDRYDREPAWLILLSFLWGGLGAVFFAGLLNPVVEAAAIWVLPYVGVPLDIVMAGSGPVIAAPLVEEPAKAVFLLFILWMRELDRTTDGYVYGAAIGFGFGMTENLLYFISVTASTEAWISTVVVRTFYSALMHATCTALVGIGLAAGRYRGWFAKSTLLSLGSIAAVLTHMLWNGLLTYDQVTGSQFGYQLDLVLFPIEAFSIFLLFQACLWLESRSIQRELQQEAESGLLPKHHPRAIATWWKRYQAGWLQVGIDRDRYVRVATHLAKRRRQARLATGSRSEFYRDDLQRLRRQLSGLLTPSAHPDAPGGPASPPTS